MVLQAGCDGKVQQQQQQLLQGQPQAASSAGVVLL
jgi:hypothetical protein